MQMVILSLAAWLFALVAWGDLRERRIPNELSLGVAALGVVRLAMAADLSFAGYTIAAAGGVLAVAFFLFSLGIIGGGDAKVAAATTLLVGYPNVGAFLVAMALGGGVVTVLILAEQKARRFLARNPPPPEPASTSDEKPAASLPTVPYGIAIGAAGLWVLANQLLRG